MAIIGLPDNMSTAGLIARTAAVLSVLVIVRFFYRLYQVRMLFRDASQKYGVSILPHSFWLGHLEIIAKIQAKYPTDLHQQCMPLLLAKEYPEVAEQAVLYLDVWPFSHPMLAVFHPDIMAQFTQDNSRPKHSQMREEFHILSGCNDLVNQEGQVWKTWRSIFNPGFSVKNLMSLIPAFLEEIQVFRDWLGDVAESGQIVQLEPKAMRATADIIGRAALGERLDCQKGDNPFFESLKTAISWIIADHSPPSILKSMHPLRRIQFWNSNRIMKNYVKPLIERGVAEHAQNKSGSTGPKTIMSLAIKAYVDEVQGSSGVPGVDPTFVEIAVSQIKIFMLAGHDTTASTLCFIYHLLNKNQQALETIRAEHDDVFGKETDAVRAKISSNPQLLNQLPFTAAVIKETLRLFPPVGTVRQGSEDFFLTHPDTGIRYPTKGMMIFSCSIASQRTEQFWPRPNEFVPERWFAKEGEPFYVRKNAFRPFELGPRNCIGQELAQLELKAILAMTIRDFDISSIWDKDDPEWFGDQAYQGMLANEITGHPKKYMPVRVVKRD
ncbi:hypothetical protein J7T55_006202 [Diaporthe amygdali]|uniref:uncharacterized protein n=1 Tax=Phomopsis amygdali TaxID=1214568 RepID=UPI0022FE392D|nr:uncharacterized protein J7T55_006202 [Diaporthe amygdali]KAJ0124859.1 hypothetical protein J7T55_006202 [Diaporthe amygdali]